MSTGTGLAPWRGFRGLATDPFRTLRERMARVFDEFALPGEEALSLTGWSPSCDIYETDNEIVVKAELPGAKKEDIKVSLQNNTLRISGDRRFEEETKRENYMRVERSYGEFMRSFTLPTFVDATKVAAEFKDGILTIKLPKREEAKPKQIDVKVQ